MSVTTTSESARPSAAREVKARRVSFDFRRPPARHYVAGDLALSHLISMLSAGFPEGEEAFIRSVRFFRESVTDPRLKEQVSGFIGQEMSHGREHRGLNEALHELGYPTVEVDAFLGAVLRNVEKFIPPIVALAMTAAAEHGTAILAENVLSRDEVQQMANDENVRELLNWHAMEELEHKAVAFDVYRAVGGPEWLRIAVMLVTLANLPLTLGRALAVSMSRDPAARNPVRVLTSLARLPGSPPFRRTLPRALKYLRPGFHPDDIDTEWLVTEWRARLFNEPVMTT